MNANTPTPATGVSVNYHPATPPRTQAQRWADERAERRQRLDDLWEAQHAHLSMEEWMEAREARIF